LERNKKPAVFYFRSLRYAQTPALADKRFFVGAESLVLPQAGCAQKRQKIYAFARLPPRPRLWLPNFTPIHY
jgi:hypothetical protein